MSQSYEYTDSGAVKLTIQPSLVLRDGAYVEVDWPDSPVIGRSIHLPAAERQAAAQALAGDAYRVVPVDDHDRPTPVDPADVKVGDVVEVEAADGSWAVRGEVGTIDPSSSQFRLRLRIDRHGHDGLWPRLHESTVRRLSRAEPGTADVEALTAIVRDVNVVTWDSSEEYARELVRRGVRVTGGERS